MDKGKKKDDGKKRKYSKTTTTQTLHMITFAEIPANFKLLIGNAAQGSVIAGSKLKKIDAFKDLSKHMIKEAGVDWDVKSTKKRWDAMFSKYKSTKSAYEDTGGTKFCLSEKEAASGMIIDEKVTKENRS